MRASLWFDLLASPSVGLCGAGVHGLERAHPLRARPRVERARLRHNAALGAMAALAERVAVMPSLLAIARARERRRAGLLRRIASRPLRAAISLLALDLGMYLWHRASHQVPLFWRFHRVHHSDLALDVTTAFRLHPGELVLSIAARGAQIALLGPSVRTVLAYEALMQVAALFHHGNVDLGERAERRLRRLTMTPQLHTRHHAARARERACNWGIVLSVWDRLLRSYEARASDDRRLGVADERDARALTVARLLRLPFDRTAHRVRSARAE